MVDIELEEGISGVKDNLKKRASALFYLNYFTNNRILVR